ncbi:integrase core domain-containing protein [Stenotrophomonas sp. JC08]|uniref:integrase core domain-containing protein n=1 Tax=Stenotrophomonas sp. JC08 TaxID=3445779 RepID=UPI003FA1DC00
MGGPTSLISVGAAGVHHPALPATERDGGAGDPDTLKEQCVHRHRFESQTHALRVIGDWIAFYNQQRPHQALKMMTPDAAYAATLTV